MKFINTLSLLIGAAAASPFQVGRRDSQNPDKFLLKTSGSENPDHNDLYVYGYHTGAGLNDAVLTPDVETASTGFLNGTKLQFDYDTQFSWGMNPVGVTNYAAWQFVQINAGASQDGFSVNSTGLQFSQEKGFGGWLVCDWWHNAPQLFYLYRYYTAQYPGSCSEVKLLTEPAA
ncbi:uncharacterized protein APUU_80734S [Aspergillus puulaauensis]|uniref:DUF7907 domain-containing protein n=1 Tax=Aspergillus puulaauensis TaxID=1220207 RepID=A0A7R8ATH7_9EURO|nr:uncharacterized protein APUU_80734S [Aspergillus puulaauensis]BCS30431.1 hypothetical protein APUU_80734S [Aspergillus puulaauensis]